VNNPPLCGRDPHAIEAHELIRLKDTGRKQLKIITNKFITQFEKGVYGVSIKLYIELCSERQEPQDEKIPSSPLFLR